MTKQTKEDPRALALRLLRGVTERGEMLSDLLAEVTASGPTEATALRLTNSTLRNLSKADTALKPHLGRPVSPELRALMRLAVVEMLAEGGAPHGVVSAAVGLARSNRKTARASGLVNAVLRRVAEAGPEPFEAADAPRLPNWMRGRLSAAYGNKTAAAIETAHARGAALDITPKEAPEAWAERLSATRLPTGSLRLTGRVQVSALPGYDDGAWWVQDAGAALAARVLAPSPGARVLDLCAAPGGKTLQLASMGAVVTALDISGPRLVRLSENLARCGLQAEIVTEDALAFEAEPFDAILLDAPCSATGTIRRHPDLPHVRKPENLKSLAGLQSDLIDKALSLLKPGGRLVYCTCSLFPDEGEVQIAAALERHPGMAHDTEAEALPDLDPAWRLADGGIRTRPDQWAEHGGIDGFFIAALRAPAVS